MKLLHHLLLIMIVLCGGLATAQSRLPPIGFDKLLGADAEAEILADPVTYPVLAREGHPQVHAYLDGILERILGSGEVLHAAEFEWTLHVVDNPNTVNAFATPGGYLFVYTGLLGYLKSEAEVAGVLAHEVAHADRRHSVRQMAKATVARLLQRSRGAGAKPVLGELLSLKHSREDETDADACAVRYLCTTAYYVPSITGFFERMSAEGGAARPEFLSTHPHDESRVKAMNAAIAELDCTGELRGVEAHEAIVALLPGRVPPGRGHRYCELLIARRKGLKGELEIWGTQGVSECPDDCEATFDLEAIRKVNKAKRVVLNGPRVWLPNTPAPTPPASDRRTFDGVEMGLIATLVVKRGQEDKAYEQRDVSRRSSCTFEAGEEIYELRSPEGATYVMRSMSQTVDPRLTLEDLPALGERLELPKGWTYAARTLETNLELTSTDIAVIVQDELKNTYQRR